MRIKALAVGLMAGAATLAFAPSASATHHPLVESFDCAFAKAQAPHGDVASPPGQSEPGSPSDHRAINATSDGGTKTSPAWFGHKLDGQCGKVGQ